MKNIYDLLNQAEDNEDILSENERMEMTDIEKRRIYNRILLDSEEEQEEAPRDEDGGCAAGGRGGAAGAGALGRALRRGRVRAAADGRGRADARQVGL